MKLLRSALVLAIATGCFSIAHSASAGYVNGVVKNDSSQLEYALYIPGASTDDNDQSKLNWPWMPRQPKKSPGNQPVKPPRGPTPLVVVLHGCFQTGKNMADGTDMNTFADRHSFYVAYPEQTFGANPWKCWNFFKEENLSRAQGELQLIASIARDVKKSYDVDLNRVYVVGFSAGAAMAANALACYSDVFAAGAVHSGIEYYGAASESEAHEVMKNGSTRSTHDTARLAYNCTKKRGGFSPVLMIHGENDSTVNPVNGAHVMEQTLDFNDLLDDGRMNKSLQLQKSERDLPAEGANGLAATATSYTSRGTLVAKSVLVHHMTHAWSGGKSSVPYMEPKGPNASKLIVEFFQLGKK